MIKELDIAVSPVQAGDADRIKSLASDSLGIKSGEITSIRIVRRSIDARSRAVKILLRLKIYIGESPYPEEKIPAPQYKNDVSACRPVLIIGAGPAGLFAALRMLELGLKPVIIERGKDVRSRRRDIAAISKLHIVNPDSNYCFGEGGAGTYSDGKLYTRSTKRGDVFKVLTMLVHHGADKNILIDAHPHIGTNKLPKLIADIRATILGKGGEIHFNTRVTGLIRDNGEIKGVRTTGAVSGKENEFIAKQAILATGHSARDIFEMLRRENVLIEAKAFALGVRVEHPQQLIDSIQYHCPLEKVDELRRYLPAASYSLIHQAKGRGVYSFCMCPGGIIAPCATSPGEIVTNGWSPSRRNNPFANSGMVVSVELKDMSAYDKHGPLSALRFQQEVEKAAWIAGGKTQAAPAQRLSDFIRGALSSSLPPTSYQPGVVPALLDEILPSFISSSLREGLQAFGKKMKGYLHPDAVLVATESRTSSPVRIPRDKETLQHPEIRGLYPCGEGAGYAGGIVSAAIDGMRCAEKCAGE